MKSIWKLIGATLIALQPIWAQSQDLPEITKPELFGHISFLAADSLKGRKAGTPEGKKAARYIWHEMVKLPGFRPLVQNGLQPFEIVTSVKRGPNNHLSFSHFQGHAGVDFTPVAFSSNGDVSAPVVFVGYGFDFDEDSLSWHDYDSVDVAGKWVMVLRGDPEIDQPHSLFANYSSLRKKALVARDHRAAGMLVVSGKEFDAKDELKKLVFDQSLTDAGLPILHVKRTVADQILSPTGNTIASLEKRLNETRKPFSFPVSGTVHAVTDVQKVKAITQNVVFLLEGSDPVLKDEFVVVGAHYDHLGMGGPGSGSRRPDTLAVHNGADDNASGVSAVLEIAEKLAAHRSQLKRSVVLVSFSAEEMGILGSKYFTEHPPVDLSQVTCMVNLDMIGRLKNDTTAITIGGTGTAIGLEQLVLDQAAKHGLRVHTSPEGYGPSDHASFYIKDVPVLFFFTNPHEDYHTPDDDVDKINFDGIKKIAGCAYDLVVELCNRPQKLVYQEAGPKERPGARRRFKVTLGIMPNYASTERNGLRADAVIPGRPAARAGMKKGDVIVAMEGKPIRDIYDYMNRLSDFEPGQRISVEVLRNGKRVILIVEL